MTFCLFVFLSDLPHQVLPEDIIVLAEPDPTDMVQAIEKAISMLPKVDPQAMHLRVSGFFCTHIVCCKMCYSIVFVFDSCIYFQMKKLYSWHDVAKRTEIVYDRALRCSNQNLLERLSRYEKRIHIFVISYLPNCGLGKESLKMGVYCDL